jgi:hypothetical protein
MKNRWNRRQFIAAGAALGALPSLLHADETKAMLSKPVPATSKPRHMADNLGAGFGIMPDASMRRRMADYFKSL